MSEFRQALDELALIRDHVARSCQFEGLGPGTVSLTGLLALIAAAAQGVWLQNPAAHAIDFIVYWYITAVGCMTVIAIEVVIRSSQVHGSMAVPLIQQVAQHFCPVLAAGGLLTVALMRSDPTSAWMLPGLWHIIFSFGAFAMAPMLPKPMFVVGVWYLICGLVCLQKGTFEALSGWTMGIPFGIGQLMVAGILVRRQHVDTVR